MHEDFHARLWCKSVANSWTHFRRGEPLTQWTWMLAPKCPLFRGSTFMYSFFFCQCKRAFTVLLIEGIIGAWIDCPLINNNYSPFPPPPPPHIKFLMTAQYKWPLSSLQEWPPHFRLDQPNPLDFFKPSLKPGQRWPDSIDRGDYIRRYHWLEYGLFHVDFVLMTGLQAGREGSVGATGCDFRHWITHHLL